jgi:hypothetical protein
LWWPALWWVSDGDCDTCDDEDDWRAMGAGRLGCEWDSVTVDAMLTFRRVAAAGWVGEVRCRYKSRWRGGPAATGQRRAMARRAAVTVILAPLVNASCISIPPWGSIAWSELAAGVYRRVSNDEVTTSALPNHQRRSELLQPSAESG